MRSTSSLTSYSSQYLVSCQLFLLIQLTTLGGPGTTWEPFPRPDRPCVCIPILCHLWGLDQLLVTKGRKLSFRSQICNFLAALRIHDSFASPSTKTMLLFMGCTAAFLFAEHPCYCIVSFHDRLEMFICYRLQWHIILGILLF